jgi:hypothetical protein
MDKFWKWMKKNNYGDVNSYTKTNFVYTNISGTALPTKQMLIGYMIDYISKHKYWKESPDQPFPHYEMEFRMSVWAKDCYGELENIIKVINKENNIE